ncbi:hypothetical protein BT63DRAFT_66528 [Microthyrium microscopicum]|uniref:Uncharacterized protein n=1 Tax=Microthyrium microscopicum TaxID=703497 RepID=A0A6A6U2G9_9PEZI|nr:hypothetical protein BT63DRAFT_66528 [Microthyrium microscopicum]
MVLLTSSVVLLCVTVLGCSHYLPVSALHIASITFSKPTIGATHKMNSEFRIGYLGLCSRSFNKSWICTSRSAQSLETVNKNYSNQLQIALQAYPGTVYAIAIAATVLLGCICNALFLRFPGWQTLELDKPKTSESKQIGTDINGSKGDESKDDIIYVMEFPSSYLQRAVGVSLILAMSVLWSAQLWQALAIWSVTSGLKDKGSNIEAKIGLLSMGMNWGACILLISASIRWCFQYTLMRSAEKSKED